MDIQCLKPRRNFDPQQPSKKRKLQNTGHKAKRQKVGTDEDLGGMRQDSMDEDEPATSIDFDSDGIEENFDM